MVSLVSHGVDLGDAQSLLLEGLHERFQVLLIYFHDGVCVFNGDTHLQQVFREGLLADEVLCSLGEDEFDEREETARVVGAEFLVLAQLDQFFLVIRLVHDLLEDLLQHELELDGTDFVQLDHLREDPLWTVDVSAELKSHLFYNYYT